MREQARERAMERHANMIVEYLNGVPVARLRETYGHANPSLLMRELDMPMRRRQRKWTEHERQMVAEYHKRSGLTLRETAAVFGCSQSNVWLWAKTYPKKRRLQ